jgi:hypothetical protein
MKFSSIACALALAACTAAQAAPVTFEFTGLIDSSDVAGYEGGSTVSGSFTYDPEMATQMDLQSLGDGFQLATYAATAGSMLLNIGGEALSFSNLSIVVLDGDGTGEGMEAITFSADGMTRNGVSSDGALSLMLATTGANQDVLTTDLPLTLDLADFDMPFMSPLGTYFTNLTSNAQSAAFTITSLTSATTSVPEPATAWSMLVGLGVIGGVMRARRA